MKKALLLFVAACGIKQATAQSVQQIITVQDSVSINTHWTDQNQYLLKGYVYVTAGATLTIDSGVVIKGDKNTKGTLIVERGAKIIANGTPTAPVVFTSNQAVNNRYHGDWGGIIICGNAPVNWTAGQAQVEGGPRSFYGGTNPNDNSGKLSYVRIEFSGIALSPNNETNGLTLAGVGDATQIDHIMVSHCGDDAFEFFGGTVNAKYLVSHRTWDDDFDTDNQYTGKIQFGVTLRDPLIADVSGSKAFESDAYGTGTATGLGGDTSKITKPIFSNMTLIGPMVTPTSTGIDPQYVAGVHIRRGSGLSLVNSVIGGWPCGLLIDESSSAYGSTTANIATQMLQFRNNIIAGTATNSTPNPKDVVYVINGARSLTPTLAHGDSTTGSPFTPFAGPWSFVKNPAFGNFIYPTVQNGVRLTNPFDLVNPNFIPQSSSPISFGQKVFNGITRTFDPLKPINYDTTGNGVNYNVPTVPPDFTNNKAADPFFTNVNYVGAFGGTGTTADNWMAGWTNFNPTVTNYDPKVIAGISPIEESLNTASVFPNPASRGTAYLTIKMKESEHLTIRLVDVAGKVVKVFVNDEKLSGAQTILLDLNDVQNGFYFVNIISQSAQKSIKLSVIK